MYQIIAEQCYFVKSHKCQKVLHLHYYSYFYLLSAILTDSDYLGYSVAQIVGKAVKELQEYMGKLPSLLFSVDGIWGL